MTYILVMGVAAFSLALGYTGFMGKIFSFQGKRRFRTVALVTILAMLLVVTAISSTNKTLRSKSDFETYATAWDDMNVLVKQAADSGATSILVELPPNPAKLGDIRNDSSYWVNLCVDCYYGLTVLTDNLR